MWTPAFSFVTAWRVSAALVLLLLVGASVPVGAAGGILVTPARLEAVVGDDGRVPPVVLQNRSGQAVWVEARPVWGTHDLYGMPILHPADSLPDVKVQVSPNRFELAPGQRIAVEARLERPERPLYPVLLFEIGPQATAPPSSAITQIAVPLLLVPHGHELGSAVVLGGWVDGVEEGPGVRVHVIVGNDGAAHARTGGSARITHNESGQVTEIPLPEQLILPGLGRLLEVEWRPPELAAGRYSVDFAGIATDELAGLPSFEVRAGMSITSTYGPTAHGPLAHLAEIDG